MARSQVSEVPVASGGDGLRSQRRWTKTVSGMVTGMVFKSQREWNGVKEVCFCGKRNMPKDPQNAWPTSTSWPLHEWTATFLEAYPCGHESKRFGMEHVLLNISFHTPFHTSGTACLFAVPYPSFHTYGFLVYNCSRFNQNVRFAC